jgi:hypothetical protein
MKLCFVVGPVGQQTLKRAARNSSTASGTSQARDTWSLLACREQGKYNERMERLSQGPGCYCGPAFEVDDHTRDHQGVADIADSFRQDADAEDANPTYKH